ncbi:retrovirus-related pol polyprotein from transposon TNT 1-94 [Tanacetum coccineum]
MITQRTDVPSGNNTKVSGSIIEPLVPDVTQSHITNQASTSSHPVPQDIWLRDQHIELVNIIGDPSEGMLTRSMAAKLTATSASECLFTNFLSEIEPKKVSEALKHPRWIHAMKEELNQFYRNKVRTLVPLPYGKIAIVARMEAIRIFLAFGTYMNFKVYQMDVKSAFSNGKLKEEVYVKQPLGFESSEFPDYVCKLDKAFYGLKQAPMAWYETLSTFLLQNKFARGRIDNTLFIYKSKGEVLLVQVYVDDIIFGSTSYKLCKQFEKLMTKEFEMSMMGELTYFLGLQIKQDDKGILICQEQYTRNLLKKYEISIVPYPMCKISVQSKGITSNSCEKNPQVPERKSTSAKAEYVVAAGCCASILWMKSQLSDYDIHYKMVPIFCDNTSAIAIFNNPVLHSRTKHIDIRYYFIKDHILKGDIELHFIPTKYQLADIFTKPLDEPTFTRLKVVLFLFTDRLKVVRRGCCREDGE